MSDAIRLGKRAFAWATVVATITWSMGLAAFIAPMTAQAADLKDGDLIKGSLPSVYYYFGGKRYVFPTQKTFLTWYTNAELQGEAKGGLVKTITNAELAAIQIGGNVTYKPGVRMVKITTDPKVYAVDAAGQLRWITTEAAAVALYGAGWATLVDDVPDAFFINYKASTTSGDIDAANDYDAAAVKTAATSYALDSGLGSTPSTPTTPTTPAGGALTISLSPTSPAAKTIVTDSTANEEGQRALVSSVRFSAGSSDVSVSKVVLRRSGIAADGDLDEMYLYDGKALLNQATSVSSGVATFSKTGGLFTVTANSYKDIDLWVDIDSAASAGITVGWSLASADVTSTATSVSGTAAGANHTVAQVADLAHLEIANVSPSATGTVDPQDDYDVWKFRLDANSQDMLVEKITISNIGSIDGDDLQNFELYYAGTQVGSAIPLMTSNTLTFDLTSMADGGFKIKSGQQRQFALRADVLGGTNRTFRFGVQESTDIWVKDLNYNVYSVVVADGTNAFAVTQAGGATTVNTGSLTQTIHTGSPTGNIPDGASDVLFAKFNFKASGEDVKVKNLDISCGGNASTNVLANVKLLYNGSQVGSTMTTLTCDSASPSGTDFSLGNTVKIAAGVTGLFEVRGDLTNSTIAANDTVSVAFVAGSSNANGTVSLTSISTTAISGRTLTVKSGELSVTKNAALSGYTSTRPLGVMGTAGSRIGSFVITGGAEASDISQIVLKDDVDSSSDGETLADYFANLSIKHGDKMLHSSALSLTDTDATTYTFNVSPAITVGVGETYVVDVYGDLLSSAGSGAALSDVNTDDTDGEILVDQVVGYGVNTGSTTTYSTDVYLQNLYIATNGSLRVTLDGDAPSDTQLVLGSTDQVLAKFKLEEQSQAEDILIKKFVVADELTAYSSTAASTGTIRNLKLYNGSTLVGTVASLNDTTNTTTPIAIFDLTGLADGGFKLSKGTSSVLTLKADLSPWSEGGVSSSTHRARMYTGDYDKVSTGVQEYVDAIGIGSGFAISTTDATATSGLVFGSTTGYTQTHVNGNTMDAFVTKLSIAYSDDTGKVSPSGTGKTGTTNMVVAIFKVSNSANVKGQAATLKLLNLDINVGGISLTDANKNLYIYKTNTDSSNQLASTSYNYTYANYQDTYINEDAFTDLEVSAGTSMYVYVTIDMDDSTVVDAGADSLSVGIGTGSQGGRSPVVWSDGTTTSITEVNGMPLSGRSMSF